MSDTIEDLLRSARPSFAPWMHYHREADSLEIHVRDGATIRRRVDHVLTVYESPSSGEMAGCMLKGVNRLLREYDGAVGVAITKGGKVKAKLVVMAYVMKHPEVLREPHNGSALADVLNGVKDAELEFASC